MTDTITLHASSLADKHEFEDGDIMFDVLSDAKRDTFNDHEVLVAVVRKHLLPLLPGVEIDVFKSSHNPVRATDEWKAFCEASKTSVEVPISEILSIAAETIQA